MQIEPKKDGTYSLATIKVIEALNRDDIRKINTMQIYTIFQGLINTIEKLRRKL